MKLNHPILRRVSFDFHRYGFAHVDGRALLPRRPAIHHDMRLPTTPTEWLSRASDVTMMYSLSLRLIQLIRTVNCFRYTSDGCILSQKSKFLLFELQYPLVKRVIHLLNFPQYRSLFSGVRPIFLFSKCLSYFVAPYDSFATLWP